MRIICFGDSNTWGYDPRSFFGDRYDAADRWTDLLAADTGLEVVNAGENGREIPRFPDFPRLAEDDLLLVMLGTNDLLQGADAAARMDTFLAHLNHRNVLLVCPPPMKRGAWVPTDELVQESILLSGKYRALAEKHRIPFIDTSGWNIELCFDGVHFTVAGHHRFAQLLKKSLTLPQRDSLY